jgi:Uri superfamily endonuclease
MSALPGLQIDSPESLRAAGFEGFARVRDLKRDDCLSVPRENGVYVALRPGGGEPRFLSKGTGAHWRGQDPNVKLEALTEKWVSGAIVLYIGRAEGAGVRSKLQQRIKRYLRFGEGRNVAHWGGRHLWQLADAYDTLVAWKVCADAGRQEAALQAAFVKQFGALPFANLRQESGDEA